MEPAVPEADDETRSYEARPTARRLQSTKTTMTTKRRRKSRARSRGQTVQTVLAVCALMGCFVYPLSLAMRSTGERIAQESERGHDVMLEQTR